MSKVVNLRTARKQKARAAARDAAAVKAASHGRTKADRASEAAEIARAHPQPVLRHAPLRPMLAEGSGAVGAEQSRSAVPPAPAPAIRACRRP